MSSDTIITVLVIAPAVLVIGGLSIMGIFRKAWSILTGLVCLLAAAGCIFLAWNTGGPSTDTTQVVEQSVELAEASVITDFLGIPADRTDLVIVFCAIAGLGLLSLLVTIILAGQKRRSASAWGIVFFVSLLVSVIIVFVCRFNDTPSAAEIEARKATEAAEATATPEPTQQAAPSDEWTDDIPYQAELVLSQIAEDMAKQAAQNPGTVDMKDLTMGFANKGNIYAVQSEFECSNLMGVTETHTIRVLCEANEDQSKIQPYEVYLDDVLVASLDQ